MRIYQSSTIAWAMLSLTLPSLALAENTFQITGSQHAGYTLTGPAASTYSPFGRYSLGISARSTDITVQTRYFSKRSQVDTKEIETGWGLSTVGDAKLQFEFSPLGRPSHDFTAPRLEARADFFSPIAYSGSTRQLQGTDSSVQTKFLNTRLLFQGEVPLNSVAMGLGIDPIKFSADVRVKKAWGEFQACIAGSAGVLVGQFISVGEQRDVLAADARASGCLSVYLHRIGKLGYRVEASALVHRKPQALSAPMDSQNLGFDFRVEQEGRLSRIADSPLFVNYKHQAIFRTNNNSLNQAALESHTVGVGVEY